MVPRGDDPRLQRSLLARLVCSVSQRTRSARQWRTWRPILKPRSGAEVALVAQGAFGDAEEAAGLLEGEHLVAGVLGGATVLSGVDQ